MAGKLFGKKVGMVIKHRGAFKAKAMAVGKSTCQYAKIMKSAPGVTGKQARLALTLMRMKGHCR